VSKKVVLINELVRPKDIKKNVDIIADVTTYGLVICFVYLLPYVSISNHNFREKLFLLFHLLQVSLPVPVVMLSKA